MNLSFCLCIDGYDEDDKICSNVTCSSEYFTCDKHRCIRYIYRFNRFKINKLIYFYFIKN